MTQYTGLFGSEAMLKLPKNSRVFFHNERSKKKIDVRLNISKSVAQNVTDCWPEMS